MTTSIPMSQPSATEQDTHHAAYQRIYKFMFAAALAGVGVLMWHLLWPVTLGFLLGAAVSLINFYWLKQTIFNFTTSMGRAPNSPLTSRVVLRFLLRYILIALGAYAIFKVSQEALYGFLAGLSLVVAGVFCEAVYELLLPREREN
jgi:hypothetical protein